eukprot:239010_1
MFNIKLRLLIFLFVIIIFITSIEYLYFQYTPSISTDITNPIILCNNQHPISTNIEQQSLNNYNHIKINKWNNISSIRHKLSYLLNGNIQYESNNHSATWSQNFIDFPYKHLKPEIARFFKTIQQAT